jgi:hypothetical protein
MSDQIDTSPEAIGALVERLFESDAASALTNRAGRVVDALAARVKELEAERGKAEAALKEAVSHLRKVHDDAFKQAAGHGLMTTDGRSFSCFQINRCQEVAGECERAIARTTKENSHE